MMHLVAYYSSVDPAGAYTALNAVQDPAINTRGTDVRIASEIPFIFGAAGLTAAAVYTSSQLRSPSLRTLNNMFVRPLNNAVTFANPAPVMTFPLNPRGMVTAEDLQFWTDSTPGAGAETHYGLVWMSDGPLTPVNGEIFSVGATSASALTVGTWVNSPITFDQALPSGTYQCVGMRAEGANLVASRLVFPGGGANSWRPGCPASTSAFVLEADNFRKGKLNVYGTFRQDNPPTVDNLGITDTAQVLTLDLIKTA
tara:strand:- start:131 stop:895 length:765 start_codon:yes stop_codon:yes gene_type:complete